MGANSFSAMEIDAIGEIMNISLGASATALSTLLGTKVNITTPKVSVLGSDEFEYRNLDPAIGVEISYIAGLSGKSVMLFRNDDIRIIVGMLLGEKIAENDFVLDEISISAICEVMNQMMGSSATALSELLGTSVNISTPTSFDASSISSFKEVYFPVGTEMVVVHFLLEIEGYMSSEFLNIIPIELTKRLLEPFGFAELEERIEEPAITVQEAVEPTAATEQIVHPTPSPVVEQIVHSTPSPVIEQTVHSTPAAEQIVYPAPATDAERVVYPAHDDTAMLQLLSQMQQTQAHILEMVHDIKTEEKPRKEDSETRSVIRSMSSEQMDMGHGTGVIEKANQEMLMQVPLEVSVEIGRTKRMVRDILEFTQGSLVVLDKMAGEQVDLFVNGQCIAKGDIVVVEDSFGIRITEIVSKNLNQEKL